MITKEFVLNSLEELQLKASAYSWLCDKEHRSYSNISKYFGFSTILSTSITGFLESIVNNPSISGTNYSQAMRIISPIILFTTAFMNGLNQYLNYDKKAQHFKISNTKYNTLYNKIKSLIVSIKIGNLEDIDLMLAEYKEVLKTFSDIDTTTNDISLKTLELFKKTFQGQNIIEEKIKEINHSPGKSKTDSVDIQLDEIIEDQNKYSKREIKDIGNDKSLKELPLNLFETDSPSSSSKSIYFYTKGKSFNEDKDPSNYKSKSPKSEESNKSIEELETLIKNSSGSPLMTNKSIKNKIPDIDSKLNYELERFMNNI